MAKKLTSLDDVIGHSKVISFLKKRIQDDNVADVIIFHGPPGVGKSSIAKSLAVEVTCRYGDESLRQAYIESVIQKNISTDSIKLFNMSEVQEKDEEIQKVKSELSVGFASTGRKVLILDEAHNIRPKAQDAILTELEHLPKDVYVFICTTEINALRDALKSRSKATITLNSLSSVEAKQVVRRAIRERMLTFDISQAVVETLICDWANNQPRKMCNLLDNFAEGSVVKSRDLEVFINVSTAAAMIELLKYLYGSMVLGIAFLEDVKYDESFVTMLIEVCKVALGHKSNNMSREDMLCIVNEMEGKDLKHILQFTAEVAGLSDLRKRKVISAFMRAHVEYEQMTQPKQRKQEVIRAEDIKTVSEGVKTVAIDVLSDVSLKVPSLDELFSNSDRVE